MYDDDGMCANCGGIRVAKSTLCAECLVACGLRAGNKIHRIEKQLEDCFYDAAVIIEEKDAEIEKLKQSLELHKKLIRYIFREYQAVRGIKSVDILA